MALSNAYNQTLGQLAEFFAAIQEGQAPDQFSIKHLKDLGFTSSNHRTLIPILKALGFLTPEGVPTPRYHEYRSKAQARRVMGEALHEAYGDLFLLKENPTEEDRPLIEGKFKSTHNVSDRLAKLMTGTFFALLDLADLPSAESKKKDEPKKDKKEKTGAEEIKKEAEKPEVQLPPASTAATLHYNIQIHLPATKDIEVFNAIFKSLKEHLLE